MPAWVTDWLPAAPWVAVILGAIVLTVKAWPLVLKLARFVDDVTGEPARPGVPARPGLMERLQAVEHQVSNDHSTNLRDDITELLHKSDTMTTQIADLAEWQRKHETRSDAIVVRIDNLEKK